MLFEIFLFLIGLYIFCLCFYIFVISVGAWFFRKKGISGTKKKIAVIIPAHNEENSIYNTVKRVFESDYPKELYKVFVIADNCSDLTALKAEEAGAIAVKRFDNIKKGKGRAISWFLNNNKNLYSALIH